MTAIQELQCVDCIVDFLETEPESSIREYVFDLLFGDIYNQANTRFILQLLFSYSVSLEARRTLECISKWIIMNIGNEIIQNLFDQLIKDHFLLIESNSNDEVTYRPQQQLINLAIISPLFSSLFMSIVLDMIANNLISNQEEKCLFKIFNLFQIWIETNPAIPLLAFKLNLSHLSLYMLNPLPGLLYTSIIYPLKVASQNCSLEAMIDESYFEAEASKINRTTLSKKFYEKYKIKAERIDELASKVHLIALKLIKDLAVSIRDSSFKLLNFKQLEFISKRIDEFNQAIVKKNLTKPIELNYYSEQTCKQILNDCLERLAQLLQLCWQFGLINCTKVETKVLFRNHLSQEEGIHKTNGVDSLLSLVLNT
jgi:hypothetical protein